MKILHLSTSARGGAGIAAQRIAESQDQAGLEINFLSRESSNLNVNLAKVVQSKINTFTQTNFFQLDKRLLTPLNVNFFTEHLISKITKYDIVQIHSFYNFISPKIIGEITKFGIPIVITMHDERLITGGCHYSDGCIKYQSTCSDCPQATKLGQRVIESNFAREIEYLNKGIYLVSPSNYLADKAKKSRKFDKHSIYTIPNPIPLHEIKIGQATTNNFKDSNFVWIGFIAIDLQNPYKGLELLRLAVMDLINWNGKILVFGSNPPDWIFSHKYFQYCGLGRNDSEVSNFIFGLDYLIVPSLEDNFPSVIGEALCRGVSVIGSDVGGIPEILLKFNQPIFPRKNILALKNTLTSLSKNYKKDFKNDAQNYFSQLRIGQEYKVLFQSFV